MLRILYIAWVLRCYGIDRIQGMPACVRYPLWILGILSVWNLQYWRVRSQRLSEGERLRAALERLGPIFVKFGQILSIRRDFFRESIINCLAQLQDNVAPFPSWVAVQKIENTYQKPISELFQSFDSAPLAAASIAQVHGAQLPDGRSVVVKILRPGIHRRVKRDIALLYSIARAIGRFSADVRAFKPMEMIAELEHCILGELNLLQEAASASQLQRNFQGSTLLRVPSVYWPYARREICVFERVNGIRISEVARLREQGVDLKLLAKRGIEIFFTQVLRDSFFHADMHPGNLFVHQPEKGDPQYIAVDFGIMGSLSAHDKRYIAANLLALFQRDYRKVALLHIESGWVPKTVRVDHFEAAIRSVAEPMFAQPQQAASFGQLLVQLLRTAKAFHMDIQPQLLLLQKTLLNVEALSTQLYPEIDLWGCAQPIIEAWIFEQRMGLRQALRQLREQTPFLLEKMPEIPRLFYEALQKWCARQDSNL